MKPKRVSLILRYKTAKQTLHAERKKLEQRLKKIDALLSGQQLKA